jgi:uncharacterized protein (TIGR02246 family)
VRKLFLIPAILGLGLFAVYLARADDSKNKPTEQKEIEKRAEEFSAAFNKGDAEAVAGFWTPDGDYIDMAGETLKGRKAIAAAFAKQFEATKGAKIQIHPTSLRVMKPDLAIEDGITEVVMSDNASVSAARYTAVHVKVDGQWFLSSVRDAAVSAATNASHLQPIEWLLGEWVEENAKGEQLEVAYSWAENQNFIVSSYAFTSKGAPLAGGTQWIGWDAAAKQIHSWTFESSGGMGQGVWSQNGDKWTIKFEMTLPDGKKLMAANTITKVDADHATWQSTGRSMDGQAIPDSEAIKLKRAK